MTIFQEAHECRYVHTAHFKAAVYLEDNHTAVHWEDCMGCGVCENRCSTGGMTPNLDPAKGLPLDVKELGVTFPPASPDASWFRPSGPPVPDISLT